MYKRASILSGLLIVLLAIATTGQDERTVYVTVEGTKTDFVNGLKAENFRLFENGTEQRIVSVGVESEPMGVGILFDVSGSVLYWGLKDLNEGAECLDRLVKRQAGSSEFFLIGFNRKAELLADWTKDPVVFRQGLEKLPNLQEGRATNVTSLHDALIQSLQKLEQSKYRKKVLILFSDGRDNSLKPKPQEVLDVARKSDSIIYVVNIVETTGDAVAGLTERLVTLSGGKIFNVNSTKPTNFVRVQTKGGVSELQSTFERLGRELDSQYALRYIASHKSKSGVRDRDVKVEIPKDLKKGKGATSIRFRKNYNWTN